MIHSVNMVTLNVSLSILGEFVLRAYFSHLNNASATFSSGNMFRSSGPKTSNNEKPNAVLCSPILSLTNSITCQHNLFNYCY